LFILSNLNSPHIENSRGSREYF